LLLPNLPAYLEVPGVLARQENAQQTGARPRS
jgi:hypothetical protein